jgi:hypothetical protein
VDAAITLLSDRPQREQLGRAGRRLVMEAWSLESMVRGYERLIDGIFASKSGGQANEVPEGGPQSGQLPVVGSYPVGAFASGP